MKIIYSNILPFKGFRAINLFGIIFARKDQLDLDERIIKHELIHTRQMIELLVIGFYIWYITEWLIKWIRYRNKYTAYKNIGFEREAYANEHLQDYLLRRKLFAFSQYI